MLAIADFQEHILPHLSSISTHTALTERDPKAVFQKITTLRGFLREERVWADALNDASSGLATQGWGKAKTFEEHSEEALMSA